MEFTEYMGTDYREGAAFGQSSYKVACKRNTHKQNKKKQTPSKASGKTAKHYEITSLNIS